MKEIKDQQLVFVRGLYLKIDIMALLALRCSSLREGESFKEVMMQAGIFYSRMNFMAILKTRWKSELKKGMSFP